MPPQSGAGVVRNKAERLGGSCVNYLVDINAHAVRDQLHFIDQANVDRAVNILEELRHLSGSGRTDRYCAINNLVIECLTSLQATRGDPTNEFGNSLRIEILVARILTLWRINQGEIFTNLQPLRFDTRKQLFFGSSGIGCALQRHDLTTTQEW